MSDVYIYTQMKCKRIREQNVNMHQQKQRSMARLKELAGRIVYRSTRHTTAHTTTTTKNHTHIGYWAANREKHSPTKIKSTNNSLEI